MRTRKPWVRDDLIRIVAEVCKYGTNHFDDEWRREDNDSFCVAMEAVSMAVACFLAQNTKSGSDGVEWEIVYEDLIKSSWSDPMEKWTSIATKLVDKFNSRDAIISKELAKQIASRINGSES